MASVNSLAERVARTASFASRSRAGVEKQAFLGKMLGNTIGPALGRGLGAMSSGLSNMGRGAVGMKPIASTVAATGAKPLTHTVGRFAAPAGAVYGAGLGAYHLGGYGKPGNPQADYTHNRGFSEGLENQYQQDIDATRAGTYNPNTGARSGNMWSTLFGYQGLSPTERDQRVAQMEAKLRAAQGGTGTLGDYKGNQTLGNDLYGTTHEQARQKALDAAGQGVDQGGYNPGLFQRAMLDNTDRNVSADSAKAMRDFIARYGPKKYSPSAVNQFSYIGGRPAGPVDFSHLGTGTGFGHDYSGYYQPYGMR